MIKSKKQFIKFVTCFLVGSTFGFGGIAVPDSSIPTQTTIVNAASSSYHAALSSGYFYARHENMSKRAIYHQLCSKYGDGFSKHAASYAVHHIHGVSWNKNALKSARFYRHSEHMSNSAIYHQLISSYGDMFTKSQARYAIHHL